MRFSFRQIPLVLAVLLSLAHFARAQTQPPPLDPAAQVMLIRNTITLINHGNLTGNYTVVRDLASDGFRKRNSAADLAATFANLREQKLDLSPILVIDPQLAEAPREIGPGRLQMVGQFPTRPQAVQFVLVFQHVGAGWMIDEVSLRVAPAEIRAPTAASGRPTASAPTSYLPTPPQPALPGEIRMADRSQPPSQPVRQR
jgi:hypothetical protein